MAFIMVLNDGETFTNLDGCKIIYMPEFDDEHGGDEITKDDIEEYGKMGDLSFSEDGDGIVISNFNMLTPITVKTVV
jgi:hypothetical protein